MRQWTVGFYGDRVFPRVMNVVCNTKESRRIRADVCAPLVGEVLEIGFGTGLNLPHLPPSVDRLLAVDPLQRGRELAGARLAESHVTVDFVGLDGQSLELEDDSVDAALSTWTLCTIPDAIAAVREIGRVLRPGGTFHFVEHGKAPDSRVQKWQDRLNITRRPPSFGDRWPSPRCRGPSESVFPRSHAPGLQRIGPPLRCGTGLSCLLRGPDKEAVMLGGLAYRIGSSAMSLRHAPATASRSAESAIRVVT